MILAACFAVIFSRMRVKFFLCVFLATGGLSHQSLGATSVYHIKPALDGTIIGLSSVAAILPTIYAKKLIRPRCPCNPSEVNTFDRRAIGNANQCASVVSDVVDALAVATPPLVDWMILGSNKVLVEDLVVYAETLSINAALTAWVKALVQRPLPRTYAGDPDLIHQAAGYRSFYSGHVSTAVSALSTAAVTIGLRYHYDVWPWIVVAGIGGTVAAARVAAGRHFYTDTIAGAVAGLLVGIGVPLFHRTKAQQPVVGVVPIRQGLQFAYTWKFN